MKRIDKANRIGEILDELYPETPIPLDHHSPYTLLVAVALSAQTTDKKVNEITPNLFSVADTPEQMARLHPDDILTIIREIGLAPTKARNLSTMAHQILEDGGEVRPDWEFLESLAGVGHKALNALTLDPLERDLKAVFPESTWNDRHLQIIFFGREYCPARFHDLTTCRICSWAATKKQMAAEARPKKR